MPEAWKWLLRFWRHYVAALVLIALMTFLSLDWSVPVFLVAMVTAFATGWWLGGSTDA